MEGSGSDCAGWKVLMVSKGILPCYQNCRGDSVSWVQRRSEFQPNEVYSLYTSEVGNRYPKNTATDSALCGSKVHK